jgi:hypothetical protein
MEKVTCRRDDRLMHLILAMGMLWDTWLPMYQFAKQKNTCCESRTFIIATSKPCELINSGSDHSTVHSSCTCEFENRLDMGTKYYTCWYL